MLIAAHSSASMFNHPQAQHAHLGVSFQQYISDVERQEGQKCRSTDEFLDGGTSVSLDLTERW